jgi:hypothetical protein
MKKVNQTIEAAVMLSADDLPDVAYHDMWEDGWSPKEAAMEALMEAGAPEDLLGF